MDKQRTIIINRAKCKLCGDIITSEHRHHFVTCSCGEITVDGGTDYLKRSARHPENLIEMSVFSDSLGVTSQARPQPNSQPIIAELVKNDIDARVILGQKKYGVVLQPDNGRDPLIDLYQELIDAAKYTRQLLYEKYGG